MKIEIYRIAGPMGVRIVRCTRVELMGVMRRIGMAQVTAEITTRPAYREMIDTLDWGAIL